MVTANPPIAEKTHMSAGKRRALIMGWVALILVGYLAMFMLIQREENRDARSWEMRLGLIAGSQARDIEHWVHARKKTLQSLAENTSLKLYMTELSLPHAAAQPATPDIEPAQQTYLRNLIIASAREGGFEAPSNNTSIRANITPEPSAGLALFDANSKPLAATAQMPVFSSLPFSIRQPKDNKAALLSEPFLSDNGKPSLAFRTPVYGIQDDASSAQPIGFIIGVSLLDEGLFDLLKTVDNAQSTEESILIHTQNQQAVYISPLKDGTKPLTLALDASAQNTELLAITQPRQFTRAKNYHKLDTLAVASAIKDTPWFVVRMIDYKTAMHDTHNRALWLSIAYALAASLLSASIVAVWKNATTMQARSIAEHFRTMAHRLERQEKLLDLIAENTPISTFITDIHGYYRYANRMASSRARMKRDDMLGKTLDAVLGKHRAKSLITGNEHATEKQLTHTENTITYNNTGDIEEAIESIHIPLNDIPIVDSEESIPGILVLEKDFTLAAQESNKRAKTLKQLVTTLVTIVDRRDPNAANHSACVAHLSEAIATEMNLSNNDIHTATTAGSLMNIGKILVSETILTANDNQDEAHRDHVRHALNASADLLDNIDFDGPVVETLRQSQEHSDGSGLPNGLKGNEILITARIVGLANDFVAIISPRAWREGKTIEQAIKIALEGIDKEYDRSVVAALINYLDNHGGRDALTQWLKQ